MQQQSWGECVKKHGFNLIEDNSFDSSGGHDNDHPTASLLSISKFIPAVLFL